MKAAAYCRVSTDREDQANSYESQQLYFTQYIRQCEGMQLYRIYADEGLSGTAAENRRAFQQMMNDARQSRFQLLLTKEVSRFSRNILDAILYTRELKALGVCVNFVNDGIRSTDPDAELRLSIMASLAQEESRKTSARVKWGQQRRMEQGVVFGHSLLGYRVKNGALYIEPEGARLVEQIFRLYAREGKSAAQISREISPPLSPATILKILRNEKYMGDLVQKKTITTDYLSHRKKTNQGEEARIMLRDHHEAIVSRELWMLAARRRQEQAQQRAAKTVVIQQMLCGLCGGKLRSRQRATKDGQRRYWFCPEKPCPLSRSLREDSIDHMLLQVWETLPLSMPLKAPNRNHLHTLKLYPDHVILRLKELPLEWIFKI